MKCLYCNQSFNDQFSLKDHYIISHNVDENNYFFRKPFTRDKFFVPRKLFYCDYFCLNRRDEKEIILFLHIIRWEVGNLMKINL